MKKIAIIVGARPQFIKASVVCKELEKYLQVKAVIIHTGQHFDQNMSRVFFDEMQIPKPDYELNINGISHGAMTGRMIEKIESVLFKEQPDFVLVFGDTNSTLAGALAAKKIHQKIVHVEAGLRSFNNRMPEEINRILTDRISDYLFCPSEAAMQNLVLEGYENFKCQIINCGDVMLDAALMYSDLAQKPQTEIPEKFILATIHREENTDEPDRFIALIRAINRVAKEIAVIMPLHPRTQKLIKSQNLKIEPAVHILEPVGYLEMLYLLKTCSLVMTDSGGLQKEAFFHHKFCITLRDETEWTELVDNGFNVISGIDPDNIYRMYSTLINKKANFNKTLYGNGKAASKILKTILN